MTEETIFATALDKQTPAERSAFLDEACGNDAALRQRVVALLEAHEQAAGFLEQPVVEQMAANSSRASNQTDAVDAIRPAVEGIMAASPGALSGETQAELSPVAEDGLSLDFLTPSEKPGALGRLDHYHVLAVIGRGGMGVVLKAFDEELQRVVAIKVMSSQMATTGTARKRFRREAQAAAAVRDEHVIDIHAVEEVNGLPYLVMEYVSGISLQERIDQGGPLELKEILRIGMQTAAGLAKAHAQGLIHRDIKPANILLENGVQRVKITDFGLARAVDDASLTLSGILAGTPQYMAPEQARGEAVDHRADLFSLGSVLYAMCTGHPPFRANSVMAVLKRVCEDTPRPIREINSEIPDWLCAIIDKLHAKEPAQRFQSAQEVADLLGQHLLHLQQPGAVPLPPPVQQPPLRLGGGRARVWPWVVATAFAAAFGVCLACWPLIDSLFTGFALRMGHTEVGPSNPEPPQFKPERTQTMITAPFVILGRDGQNDHAVHSLAAAVARAQSGDTIEIRGDGPFASGPILRVDKALTIRAGEGFQPIINLTAIDGKIEDPLLETYAPLVLEGLALQRLEPGKGREGHPERNALLLLWKAPVRAANCRFLSKTPCVGIWASESSVCDLRNCAFGGSDLHAAVDWTGPSGGLLSLQNCVLLAGPHGLVVHSRAADAKGCSVQLTHNTLSASIPFDYWLWAPIQDVLTPRGNQDSPILRVKAEANLFDAQYAVLDFKQVDQSRPLGAEEALTALQRLVSWRERQNVYPDRPRHLLLLCSAGCGEVLRTPVSPSSVATAPEWDRYWGSEIRDAIRGRFRYQGGDVRVRAKSNPEQILPSDFRLGMGSAGKGTSKNGRDLGADVDLVGPGAAYERWKKTPAYQQWLKDTKQAEGGQP